MEIGKQLGIQEAKKLGIQEGKKLGRQEGVKIALQESICDVLKLRFGKVSKSLSSAIQKIENRDALKMLHQKAVFCESLKAFQVELKNLKAQ
jgi:flagellar biosynthesis/type III secretory pathway protein FliH